MTQNDKSRMLSELISENRADNDDEQYKKVIKQKEELIDSIFEENFDMDDDDNNDVIIIDSNDQEEVITARREEDQNGNSIYLKNYKDLVDNTWYSIKKTKTKGEKSNSDISDIIDSRYSVIHDELKSYFDVVSEYKSNELDPDNIIIFDRIYGNQSLTQIKRSCEKDIKVQKYNCRVSKLQKNITELENLMEKTELNKSFDSHYDYQHVSKYKLNLNSEYSNYDQYKPFVYEEFTEIAIYKQPPNDGDENSIVMKSEIFQNNEYIIPYSLYNQRILPPVMKIDFDQIEFNLNSVGDSEYRYFQNAVIYKDLHKKGIMTLPYMGLEGIFISLTFEGVDSDKFMKRLEKILNTQNPLILQRPIYY
jgi:hypothetical protein